MNFIRPVMQVATDVCKSRQVPKWIRWPAYIVGVLLFIWPYAEMFGMIEFTNIQFLTCALAIILGAVLGEALIMNKAKANGNTIGVTDFVGIILGLCLGGFIGYIGLSIWGGALADALGDMSYPVVAFVCALFSAVVVTVVSMAYAGEGWAVDCLDYNKDGTVNADDAVAAAKNAASEVEKVVSEVKKVI